MANLSIDFEKYSRENENILRRIYDYLREQTEGGDVIAHKFLSMGEKRCTSRDAGEWLVSIIKTLFETKHDLEGRLLEKERNWMPFVQIDIQSLPEKDRNAIIECLRKGAMERMEKPAKWIQVPDEKKVEKLSKQR